MPGAQKEKKWKMGEIEEMCPVGGEKRRKQGKKRGCGGHQRGRGQIVIRCADSE